VAVAFRRKRHPPVGGCEKTAVMSWASRLGIIVTCGLPSLAAQAVTRAGGWPVPGTSWRQVGTASGSTPEAAPPGSTLRRLQPRRRLGAAAAGHRHRPEPVAVITGPPGGICPVGSRRLRFGNIHGPRAATGIQPRRVGRTIPTGSSFEEAPHGRVPAVRTEVAS
jgi:hypothetical protein